MLGEDFNRDLLLWRVFRVERLQEALVEEAVEEAVPSLRIRRRSLAAGSWEEGFRRSLSCVEFIELKYCN